MCRNTWGKYCMCKILISKIIQLVMLYSWILVHYLIVQSLRFIGTHTRSFEEKATHLVDFSILKAFWDFVNIYNTMKAFSFQNLLKTMGNVKNPSITLWLWPWHFVIHTFW